MMAVHQIPDPPPQPSTAIFGGMGDFGGIFRLFFVRAGKAENRLCEAQVEEVSGSH
jgi:hypothetical protein